MQFGSNDESRLFSGQYCERFPGELQPCKVLSDCVECLAFQSGPEANSDQECSACASLTYREIVPENITSELSSSGSVCSATNSAGCTFRFTSSLIARDEVIIFLHIIDGEKEVCAKFSVTGITFIALAIIIVLAGIVLALIWKCYIVIDDRRMYAKFEKDRKQLQYATNQNPNDIYKSPITEYRNPMYGKAIN